MKRYSKVEVSEQLLEDLVRQSPELIEEGLRYVDHQRQTPGGRLDVLLVDSGKSLVVAELKVVEEDGMLLQGLDYYDYVTAHVEAYGRLYKALEIDPSQEVRLVLVAPSFSQTLLNRCKWLNVTISLYTFSCLQFEGDDEIVPVFTEQDIPAPPPPPEVVHPDQVLSYIMDHGVRAKVAALLHEIEGWKPENISVTAIKGGISMKVNGRVFAYLWPCRQRYTVVAYDVEDVWRQYPIKSDEDLAAVKPIVRASMERRLK